MSAHLNILVISLILKMSLKPICSQLGPNAKTLITFFILWSVSFCYAQDTEVNSLDLYQTEAPLTCEYTIIESNNGFQVYGILNFSEQPQDTLWAAYALETGDDTIIDSVSFVPRNKRQLLRWDFLEGGMPYTITVTVNWKSREWVFKEHIPDGGYHPTGGVSIWHRSLPMARSWINSQDSIQIRLLEGSDVFVYYYSHKFDPARPPMKVQPGQGSGSLTIDSIFVIPAGTYYKPNRTGLYFFQADSSTNLGNSLVVADNSYPQPREISDLTEPLVYITTKAEYQNLKSDFDNKQSLDKFWLSTLGTPERARSAIKLYYQNIEEANFFFTSYKEGWKTDKGMIYTVMGKPSRVVIDADTETWYYQEIVGDELAFVFKKVGNIFSHNHYELYRDESYDRSWFQAIDRWREGRNY